MTSPPNDLAAEQHSDRVVRRRPRRLLRRVMLYAASRGVTDGLLAIRGILLATVLGPAAFGAWALLRLSMRYAAFASLGVNRGLEVELAQAPRDPVRVGRELPARAALGFTLLVGGGLALAALALSMFVADPVARLSLRAFAAAVVVEKVWLHGLVCLRAHAALRRFATLEMIHAVLQLACATVLALIWGLAGAYTGLVLAGLAALAIAARDLSFVPALAFGELRRLLRIGVPLTLSGILALALITGDRWVVAAVGGTTLLGYYAFAASLGGLAGTAGWVIRTVIFPDLYGRAQRAGPAAIRIHLERVVLPFARLYPVLLGALAFGIGPAVMLMLPQYRDAVAPARIFVLSGAASGILSVAILGVVAARRQHRLPLASAAALLLNLTGSFLALRLGAGLEAVAIASLVSQAMFVLVLLTLTLKAAGRTDLARAVAHTLLPLGWCTAAVVAITRFVPGLDIGSAALGLGLYLFVLLPIAPGLWRDVRRLG